MTSTRRATLCAVAGAARPSLVFKGCLYRHPATVTSTRFRSTQQPPKPQLPPMPPSTPSSSPGTEPPAPESPIEPPPKPDTGNLLQRFAAKLRSEVEELENSRKQKEAEAAKGIQDLDLGAAGPTGEQEKKKPGFLSNIDERLTAQRRELEEAQQAKRAAGQSTRVSPTMQKRMDTFLDLDANLKERDELLKQAFREGYWDDLKEAARKGAKLWEAPKRARAPNMSPQVPNPLSKTLTGEETDVLTLVKTKQVSLVTFMFSALGEGHVKTYIDPFLAAFADQPNLQVVQLNVEENWLKAPVLKLMTPLVRRSVPKERQSTYLLHYKPIIAARRAAGMTNNVLGWANLVDRQGRIRWQAHGPAKEHEIESMIRITRTLAGLAESGKVGKKAAGAAEAAMAGEAAPKSA
ncbi:ATP10 protein-domain-containing protein [Fimicolochytrium jonesii]|uniref:ATP10 protein-domain-containing protein n=1 Tax=Fimicolochytrium jonesii TaxID=1396493 RepID=UPI0022FDE816|nr:ATP10 protein-domain-containing protein [Fimicolochytrium jonesii]KAI8822032.1 ATP10 protein-domain-containing protein [Fimicolochytrium jonesii]